MTFEELKSEDKEGAFGGWRTIESAKSDGDIPEIGRASCRERVSERV